MCIYYSLLYTTAHLWVPLIPKLNRQLWYLKIAIYNYNVLLEMFTLINIFVNYNDII